jgi:hypothetical protein
MMKKAVFVIIAVVFIAEAKAVSGDNSSFASEPTTTLLNGGTNGVDAGGIEMSEEKNYQDEILSNPETNAGARVGIKRPSGNTAIINQNGSRNSSSITQSGDDNMAIQNQNGTENELYLKQTGKHNRHSETQTGNHNRKKIIQNDSETFIEQVTPEDEK